MTNGQEVKARRKANSALAKLGSEYHPTIPCHEINNILWMNDFRQMESGIFCGRDGQHKEQVGDRTWLSLSWHKMDVTGNYEIVVYLS